MWRSRRWRELHNLIERLPGNSLYAEALSQDEDLAAAWLSIPEDERPKGMVRLSESNRELLAIHDRLAEVFTLLLNVNSKSGGHKPHYSEKPESAAKRLEEQQAVENLHSSSLGGWMD